MNKLVGIALVVLGALVLFNVLMKGWFLFLLIAGGLALAANTGAVGRWGYAAAALFLALALPALAFKAVATTLAVLVSWAPVILLGFGIYVLINAFSK